VHGGISIRRVAGNPVIASWVTDNRIFAQ
jgi:hypothetical protein